MTTLNLLSTLTVYMVAGIRNVVASAVHGGLIVNIGQTHRPLDDRLNDPDYHRKAAGGGWNKFGCWSVPKQTEAQLPKVDDEVRRQLLCMYPRDVESTNNLGNTEEVIFKTDPGDGSVAIPLLIEAMKVVFGEVVIAKPQFIERGYQADDLNVVCSKLTTTHRVLLSAFPGWGKSTCAPEIMRRVAEATSMAGSLFLFTTPITDSLDGVRNALVTTGYGHRQLYVITTDMVDCSTAEVITSKLREGIHVVVLLSVQALRRGEDGSRISTEELGAINATLRMKFSFLYSIPICLWIRDEFHKQYGGQVTKQVFDGIEADRVLDMTATPYNLIELGEYVKDQIVGDTIFNVLKKKKDGVEWYRPFPSISIETWEGAPLNGTELGELYSGVEEWDPRKLLVIQNGQLVHSDAIRALNLRMYGWYRLENGKYIEGVSKEKNPFDILSDPDLSPVAREVGMHVMAEGDSEMEANDRCRLYVELLNGDSRQKMLYVTADTIKREAKSRGVSVSTIVRERLGSAKKQEKLGLTIVTHRMLLTGSDIDFLGHVVLFDRIGSLNDFVQLVGRKFRTYHGKESVKLYVACPGMNVSVKVYEAVKAEANQYGTGDPREYFDCIPITEYFESGGKFVKKQVSYEDMISRFNEYHNRILSGDWYSKNYLSNYVGLDALVDGLKFDELVGTLKGVTTKVTAGTSAKVRKPTTREAVERDNKERKLGDDWKQTVATMLNESIRLGYSNDSETLKGVFSTPAAVYEFGQPNITMIQALFTHHEFYNAVNYIYQQRVAEAKDLSCE